MKHDWIRFRLVLPLVFGFLAAVLMTWDYEKQSNVWIDGDGLGNGPAVLALSSDLPSLVHNQRSRICSVNANPQAAEPSNAFPAIRRLVSGDRGLVVVDWHSNRFQHPRSPELSICEAGCRRSFRSEPCASVFRCSRQPR